MQTFRTALLAAVACICSCSLADVDPIIIKGSKFFHKQSGEQFYVKGVAYQQDYTGQPITGTNVAGGYSDPLANPKGCTRDIPYLKQLETNTVRVYAIDPTANHDDCMKQLSDAGIYVLADLSAPSQSINSNDPSWDTDLYARYASVIDAMAKYSNVLGFFAGNEVVDAPNNTAAAPFVKAAVRDMKAYINTKGYRDIGVGYAMEDNPYVRTPAVEYFDCGSLADTVDFWGYNIYEWCGDSTYKSSGYEARTKQFETYNKPAIFAEYGCNTVQPRTFTEVLALYGPQMSPVWSGGVVYMYFQEVNNFGLVSVGNDETVTTLTAFDYLKTQIAKVSPSTTQINNYTPSNSPAACPTEYVNWTAAATPLPPSPNEQLCSCMYSGLSCAVADGVSDSKLKSLFSTVCGLDKNACAGINVDSKTGQYGAYSMCEAKEKLGFAFDQYYKSQGKASTACDFNGAAKAQQPAGESSQCKALLNQAGPAGTGTVTSTPTSTGAATGSSSGKSGASRLLSDVTAFLTFSVLFGGFLGVVILFF